MTNIDLQTDTEVLQHYLSKKNLLYADEQVHSTSKPGEGNMNVVLRVNTNQRSFILKQSRPYVQKYQQIAAPLERIEVEALFYESLDSSLLQSYTPQIFAYIPEDHLLIMQDLGSVEDMTALYQKRTIHQGDVDVLLNLLADIHQSEAPHDYPENKILRALNHQHIFVLPFLADNGFDLDEIQTGLQDLANLYKSDQKLKDAVHELGARYLAPGDTLLHGDYYPGSWMKTEEKIYILDPEFSFLGFPEFDLGVMAAHLIIASGEVVHAERIAASYTQKCDPRLVQKIAGTEIMRRLIGLAQLPIQHSLPEKKQLMEAAHRMILS